MATKLFVAGLSYAMNDSGLADLFAAFGTVESAKVVTDRDTNRSKGFGFVELSSEAEANAAIAALNGKEVEGRSLAVSVARPREERPNHGGGGGGGYQDNRNSMGNNFRRGRR